MLEDEDAGDALKAPQGRRSFPVLCRQLDAQRKLKHPKGMILSQNQGERPPILIVLHGENSTPGRIGRLLRERGFALDIRRPRFGDPLPASLSGHTGAIIFGGPMSANDADDFIKAEIDWINVPLRESKPFLGICLGAQMMARTLGKKVYRHPESRVEIGYYRIWPTELGHCACDALFPEHVYHWHREGFELPEGADLLAEGADFQIQAMRYGSSAFGLQFHPEVTYAMICRWTGHRPERMQEPGARERSQHLDGWFMYDFQVAVWLDRFLQNWAGLHKGDEKARAA